MTRKSAPEQGELGFAEPKASSGPVECLGMTFESEEARREHFLELLREKLQDPEFRKIPGFPKGSDEAILGLSDPPYYTACPNPFVAALRLEAKPDFERQPFAVDVSEGKSGALYNAHTYHTKVPPAAIVKYLMWYTRPGDIILDSYCGSGMTGVAAGLCQTPTATLRESVESLFREMEAPPPAWGERIALLNDLSPAAAFIAYCQNQPTDTVRVQELVSAALEATKAELGWVMKTAHVGWPSGERDAAKWLNGPSAGGAGEIIATLWSEIFVCGDCASEINLWKEGVSAEDAEVSDLVACPACGAKSSKSSLDRAVETHWDAYTNQTVTRNKFVPVLIIYQFGNRRYEKVPDLEDLGVIRRCAEIRDAEGPIRRMMDTEGSWGAMHRAGYHRGASHLHHFYTERNWLLISRLWRHLDHPAARFAMTSLMPRLSRMHALHLKNFFRGGGGFAAGNRKGQLYFPSLALELSPLAYLEGRAEAALEGIRPASRTPTTFTSVGSASALQLPDASVDYVFVDPPFGQNIIYSELNFLWEAWLLVATDTDEEAIIDDFRRKTLNDYQRMMTKGFSEIARVLRPGRWVTVVFHNSQNHVWRSIQEGLQQAGLVVGDVRILDKKQASQKQLVAPGTVKSDLAITAYKPSEDFVSQVDVTAGSADALWAFVRDHLEHVAIFDGNKQTASVLPERHAHMLFDRTVAFHVRHGISMPMSAAEFYEGLKHRLPERDGMYFLPDQVAEYDRKRMSVSELRQLSLFVNDEASAIQWVRQQLQDKPQTFQDLTPQYMREVQTWAKHEATVELRTILEQGFLHYDGRGPVPSQIHRYLSTNYKDLRNLEKDDPRLVEKARDRWYVADPSKQAEREAIREKALLREFEEYKTSTQRKLKVFRTEAVRVGFKACWQERDYGTIVKVAEKLPEDVLQEDEKLLMYYDNALTRLGDG